VPTAPSAQPAATRTDQAIPARNLLQRLWRQRELVLAFLDDLTVPFDNIVAERDVLMLKVQQNVSGGCRSVAGTDTYARHRAYLSILHKQGTHLLIALATVFADSPLYPALDCIVTPSSQ
jgi:hypothetical protein